MQQAYKNRSKQTQNSAAGIYHAFDMSEPKNPISKEAIKKFNERFAYAKENYFAKQESYREIIWKEYC